MQGGVLLKAMGPDSTGDPFKTEVLIGTGLFDRDGALAKTQEKQAKTTDKPKKKEATTIDKHMDNSKGIR